MKMLAPALPHQIPAIVRGCTESGVIWRMGTGTGKTLTACETLRILTNRYKQPALHIAPNSVLDQTWEEYIKWYGLSWAREHVVPAYTSPIYKGIVSSIEERKNIIEDMGSGQILLFPTESFSYKELVDELAKRIWCGVVVDEISRFRHWNRWVRGLLRIRSPHRIGASGSLVVKSCDDLWFPMKWIDKDWCGISSHNLYQKHYCVLGGYTGTIPIATRPDREADIKKKINTYCVDADLSEIRTMPKRMLSIRRVTMPAKTYTWYKELEDTLALEIASESEETFNLQIKTYASRMQRLLEIGAGFSRNQDGYVVYLPCSKTTELVNIINDDSSAPTIIWTWWTPEYKQVTERLTKEGIKWVPLKERNTFNDGECNIIIGSIAAGGYGLNLQRATRMIYHSLDFDLEHYQQSQERNWRLTTDDQPRVIIHLINSGTYDEYVREALVTKSGEALKFSRSSALKLLRRRMN